MLRDIMLIILNAILTFWVCYIWSENGVAYSRTFSFKDLAKNKNFAIV